MLPAELASWPAWTPDDNQLGELELLTSGAFTPLAGYLAATDLAAVAARGQLADGTPWPVPVTLTVPASAVPAEAGHLVLQDPEGSPLAVLGITERVPADDSGAVLRLAGPVTALRPPEHGPFRALRRTPAEVRARLGAPPVLAYATRRPLGQRQIGQLRHLAGQLRARILLLPLVAGPAELVTRPESLVRAVLAAARQLPGDALVVPVPLPPRADPVEEVRSRAVVAAAYGATHLLSEGAKGDGGARTRSAGDRFDFSKLGVEILAEGEWAFDPIAEVWRPLRLIEAGVERGELSDDELGELLDSGEPVPAWLMPADVAAELRRARPPRSRRGLVVFCTGLSGSGKSTLARDLRDALLERGDRTVSLLDGDLVRRLLSAGLTFSRADRDLNIARIGYVAAEIARHGGIAICAPIAPYATARAGVRRMVSEAGDFVLVHVSTPLEVCEARDRKGLYAQARAGVIGSFTGISDPYEEPDDAQLTIDTSQLSRHDAVAAVLGYLTRGGWLKLYPYARAEHVPDVDDRLVCHQFAVLRVRGGDDQQVGAGNDLLLRQEVRVYRDVRVCGEDIARLERESPLEFVGQTGPDVVRSPLEGHPEDADRHLPQIEPPLKPVKQVQGQPLINGHGRVPEGEVVVVERGELHRVLEQARPRGEPRTRHVRCARVVLDEGLPDALEVEAAIIGHHVELVRRRELDVPPHVREQLGELRFLWRQLDDAVRQHGEELRCPLQAARGAGGNDLR
jgi:sulfate adenylyltransferase